MRRYLKARYLAPASVALAMVVYGAVISIISTHRNLDDFGEVASSRVVLAQLGDVLSSMQDLETGQRGFIITGDESFLEPYEIARRRVDEQLDALERTLGDQTHADPGVQRDLSEAREAAREKKEELALAIATRRNEGPEVAMALVGSGVGKRYMDHFRGSVAAIRLFEENRLDERQRTLIQSFRDTNNAVVLSAAIAIGAALTGVVLLALFLTARERESRLRFEREKAVQADKAKTDFLAMMSHEIRTPMNAILGFGELLHDTVEKPQEKHFSKAILTSGNSLLSLINDILDLSKIEAAKLELRPETVEMRRFIENLETLFSFRAHQKGLEYIIHPGLSLPRYLSFDVMRLRQILVNLIGNAIKFTPHGHVTVHLSTRQEGDRVLLIGEVSDSGIGVPEEKLGEIFRPFYQVESEHGRHFQGTGLGLSISQRLIELMGGRIEVESAVGKGSTFRLTIPVEKREELSLPPDLADPGRASDFNRLKPARILVVDDVTLNRELIRGYLEGSHHQVLEAENGEQAVILCRRHLPEVVLMDVRMPVVDGRAAHATLKSLDDTRHIPLVAVTASSLPDSQAELRQIFDGFATKPISRERLYMELSKFLPVNSTAVALRPEPEVSPLPPMNFDRAWPDLVKVLVPMRDSIWPALVELVPAQATLQFGEQLAALARKHQCPPLLEYAQMIVDAASTMSFPEAGQLLAAFPDMIERLSHADL